MAGGAPFYGEIMRHCKFCKKPREVPTYRIFTEDGTFDEVACNTHGNLLEKLADLELGDKERHHIISSNNINCKYGGIMAKNIFYVVTAQNSNIRKKYKTLKGLCKFASEGYESEFLCITKVDGFVGLLIYLKRGECTPENIEATFLAASRPPKPDDNLRVGDIIKQFSEDEIPF